MLACCRPPLAGHGAPRCPQQQMKICDHRDVQWRTQRAANSAPLTRRALARAAGQLATTVATAENSAVTDSSSSSSSSSGGDAAVGSSIGCEGSDPGRGRGSDSTSDARAASPLPLTQPLHGATTWHRRRRSTSDSEAPQPQLDVQQDTALLQQQQQQQQQQRPIALDTPQPVVAFELLLPTNDDVGYQQQQQQMLADRVYSHAAASTSSSTRSSGAAGAANSAAENLALLDDRDAQQQQQQQQHPWQQPALVRCGPSANFRDQRFECAISRWIKEAPDWFRLRALYDRFERRMNIINHACALQRLAVLLSPMSGRRLLRTEATALRRFGRRLLAAAAPLLPSADAATCAALLGALSRLVATDRVEGAPEFVAALLLHLQPQLQELTPSQVVGTMWALGRLGVTPPPAWMHRMYACTPPQLGQLRGDEAAVLLRGLARMQPVPPPPPAWLSSLLSHTEDQLPELEPRHLCTMLVGLAHLQVRPPRGWLEATLAALRGRFAALGPQGTANLLWGLARLGCVPDRGWLAACFAATLPVLGASNGQELSLLAWALAQLRLEPSDEWLDEWFDASEARLPGFSLTDLCLAGYGLARLGLRPPQTWLRVFCTLLLRQKSGLWRSKTRLTQALVALDWFRVPRMDMWRRELYAAAGYKLYRYRDWRQRTRMPAAPALAPFSPSGGRGVGRRRAAARRAADAGSRSAVAAVAMQTQGAALRSGDWGVLDGGGGARGVLGSMGDSYEEQGAADVAPPGTGLPQRSSQSARSGTSGSRGAGALPSKVAARRPLRQAGLVRPTVPASLQTADDVGAPEAATLQQRAGTSTSAVDAP